MFLRDLHIWESFLLLSVVWNYKTCLYGSVYVPNPSVIDRMWHKVNFLSNVSWYELWVFLLLDGLPYQGQRTKFAYYFYLVVSVEHIDSCHFPRVFTRREILTASSKIETFRNYIPFSLSMTVNVKRASFCVYESEVRSFYAVCYIVVKSSLH